MKSTTRFTVPDDIASPILGSVDWELMSAITPLSFTPTTYPSKFNRGPPEFPWVIGASV